MRPSQWGWTRASRKGTGPRLADGSRVAVVGGGPSGSFFAYFLLQFSRRAGTEITVDLFEPKRFSAQGPGSCNMCGGIVSESLVQALAVEGILLPPSVIQMGIDSYVLHMDVGTVRIEAPARERRIASVYRSFGPRSNQEVTWESFDAFLLQAAERQGARHVPSRVEEIRIQDGHPQVRPERQEFQTYDLVAIATGVNSGARDSFRDLVPGHHAPRVTKTCIREYEMEVPSLRRELGSSMHVFLLDVPRLEFGAIIPKRRFASLCLLGEEIDRGLRDAFLGSPEVTDCMPESWERDVEACRCAPQMNVGAAVRPYGDRIVYVGDAGVTRLYKDGIGGAYRTAKAAATAAIWEGVGSDSFARVYAPICRAIESDNRIGRLLFASARLFRRYRFIRAAILRMVAREQEDPRRASRMSAILWDLFTGSSSYREILLRALHPAFWLTFLRESVAALARGPAGGKLSRAPRAAG